MHSFVAELNSHLSRSLYNELRVGLTIVRDRRDIPYRAPSVYISKAGAYDPGTGVQAAGDNNINIGTEFSSGLNALEQNNLGGLKTTSLGIWATTTLPLVRITSCTT